jgi:tetratricopeptide (TPR) repeat protein
MAILPIIGATAAFLFLQPSPSALRSIFEEGLARRREAYGVYDARTAQAARDLGLFLSRHGAEPDARNVLDQVVRIDERLFGATDPRTLADVAELAAVSAPGVSKPLWERAAESSDAAVAARALDQLARLRVAADDRTGAASLYRRALARQEQAGKDTAEVALALNALAKVVEPGEAVPLFERALVIDRRVLGARHPETATTEANLAGLLAETPRNGEAVRLAADALEVFRDTVGADHPRTAVAASILGYACEVKGDRRQAEHMYRLALAIDRRVYGPEHPQTRNDARVLNEFLKSAPR